jgi:hypothetical protein
MKMILNGAGRGSLIISFQLGIPDEPLQLPIALKLSQFFSSSTWPIQNLSYESSAEGLREIPHY